MTAGAEARLIRACGDLLGLPQRVLATALVFYHRFQHAVEEAYRLDTQRVVAACLFLASKVEEASLRTNDLLNALVFLQHEGAAGRAAAAFGSALAAPEQQQQQQQQQRDSAAPSPPSDPPMLVGAEYYERKHRLILDEQVLLRVMRFDIGVEHPHRWVYCYCRALGGSAELARASTCLVNDSLVHTDLCLRHGPEVVAAAALQAGAVLLGQALPGTEGATWWQAMGLAQDEVATASETLLELLRRQPAPPLPPAEEPGRPP